MNEQEVIHKLIEAFPSLQEELEDEDFADLFHMQMSVFAEYTQEQIDEHRKSELLKCFEIATDGLKKGDANVKNALVVSYLAHLNFKDGKRLRAWAFHEMPSMLKQQLADYEHYVTELFKDDVEKMQPKKKKPKK